MINSELPELDLDENARSIYEAAEARLSRYKDVTTRRGLATAIIGDRGEEYADQIERVASCDLTDEELRELLILQQIYPPDRTKIMRIVREALVNITYHVPPDLALEAAQAAEIKNKDILSFTPEHNRTLNIVDYICKGLSVEEAEEYQGLMERRYQISNHFFMQPQIIEALTDTFNKTGRPDAEIYKRLESILSTAFSDEEKKRIEFLENKMWGERDTDEELQTE